MAVQPSPGDGLDAIGVFDHLDRRRGALSQFYAQRLELVELYDRAGFFSYHLAEHHSTPIGMAPSPNLFLTAAAARTRRLRLGALVYLLPLYHPLRLFEEICMLDQLSDGRLDLGVGRGISPIEAAFYGADPSVSQKVFDEVLEVLMAAFSSSSLTYHGDVFGFSEVPIELEPVQRPHPPLWYGVSSASSADRCARGGFNVITQAASEDMAGIIAAHRSASADAGLSGLKAGICRFVVVADSDDEARSVANVAYEQWYQSFHALHRRYNTLPVFGERPKTFDALMPTGMGVAGSPSTVLAELQHQVDHSGANYLVCQFAFGELPQADAVRSIELFAERVMPSLLSAQKALH